MYQNLKQRLIDFRNRAFVRLYQRGHTMAEIADITGYSIDPVRKIIVDAGISRGMGGKGLGMGGKGLYRVAPEDYRKRYSRMIEMRTNGATLEDIGAETGVSRERVRQILEEYGDENLIGRNSPFHKQKAEIRERARQRKCKKCGTEFRTNNKETRFCSIKCSQSRFMKRDKLGPEIFRLRKEGWTFSAIAKKLGYKSSAAMNVKMRRWANDEGIDLEAEIGRNSKGTIREPNQSTEQR